MIFYRNFFITSAVQLMIRPKTLLSSALNAIYAIAIIIFSSSAPDFQLKKKAT